MSGRGRGRSGEGRVRGGNGPYTVGGGRGGNGPYTGGRRPDQGIWGRGGGSTGAPTGRGAPMPEARYAPMPEARHAPIPVQEATSIESSLSREREQLSQPSPIPASPPGPNVPPSSSKALLFPLRPGFGSVGRGCYLKANHFLVDVVVKDLFHYDVMISPEPIMRTTNQLIIAELVKAHQGSTLGGKLPVFDGRKSLYTAGKLPFEITDFKVKLPQRESEKEKEFKVVIKYAARTDVHHLNEFISGRQLDVPQSTIQALDIVLRQSPSNEHTTIGRSFFSPARFGPANELGEGFEYWRGYYQSLRPTQMGMMLNVDVATTAFYEGIPILDFVLKFLNLRDFYQPLSSDQYTRLKKALRGVRVEATHIPGNCIRYRISDLSKLPTKKLDFPLGEDGSRITVVQYFKEQYNCNLRHVELPCLQAGRDKRIKYLPMEVCKIVSGQRYAHKLNENQVTVMLRATCERPREREKHIISVMHQNRYNNDKYAREFGVTVSNQMVTVQARILPPPRLKYHDSGKQTTCIPEMGQWNLMGKKLFEGGRVDNWAMVSFSKFMPGNEITRFGNDLVSACTAMGMVFNPRPCIEPAKRDARNLESELRKINQLVKNTLTNKRLQLLIIILPDSSSFTYGKIKKLCETELGIVSQCCQYNKLAKGGRRYQENVALKINVKVGGRNTVLEDGLYKRMPSITQRSTIIFGADVGHPPPGDESSPSISAVVASMDWPGVTKYKGLISAQGPRQEMIRDLFTLVKDPVKGHTFGGMIRDLLISFFKANGKRKPDNIIFYRDGVSEGQFSEVLLYEVEQIRKACASLQEGYAPPLTFVVVQKRHHTRLFPEVVNGRAEFTDRSGNIQPGTVVDGGICHPTQFDFYLCSHAGIQGTSRPTHYHVIYDENNFSADDLQTLTNNLCYTYARCTRSVSIVPPAYYAHLAAYRARHYLDADQHEVLSSARDRPRERPMEIRRLPKIMENVMEVMFYC